MCATHHDVVDKRLDEFTVEKLREMKAEHEARGVTVEPKDDVIRSLLENSGFHVGIRQTSEAAGINVVSGGPVTINRGLSYSDARRIAQEVYRKNALSLTGVAKRVALERAEGLTMAFLERLRDEYAGLLGALADPDMHHALFEAQRYAARTGSVELCDILVDLLVRRARNPRRDLLQIVLGEAIATAGRLTLHQFDALTLVFELKYIRNPKVQTVTDLAQYFRTRVGPLLSGVPDSEASFRHLEYAGCAVFDIDAVRFPVILAESYGYCFFDWFGTPAEPASASDPGPSTDPSRVPRTGLSDVPAEIEAWLRGNSKRYLTADSEKEMMDCPRDSFPQLDELDRWWDGIPGRLRLTSVGIALAHANLARRGVGDVDVRQWISG